MKALVAALEYTTGLLMKRLEAVGDVLGVVRTVRETVELVQQHAGDKMAVHG